MSQDICKYICTRGKNKGIKCDKKCMKNCQFCGSHNNGRCQYENCKIRSTFNFDGKMLKPSYVPRKIKRSLKKSQ